MPLFGMVRASAKHFLSCSLCHSLHSPESTSKSLDKVEAEQHALPQGTSAKCVIIPFQACSKLQKLILLNVKTV